MEAAFAFSALKKEPAAVQSDSTIVPPVAAALAETPSDQCQTGTQELSREL
jgi:hypothetical protein